MKSSTSELDSTVDANVLRGAIYGAVVSFFYFRLNSAMFGLRHYLASWYGLALYHLYYLLYLYRKKTQK
jgi:hypothetical protein